MAQSGRALGAIAARHAIALVVGVTERVEHGPARGTLFNALLTFGPDGSLLNHHRKLVPTYTERLVWGQGDGNGVRAVDVPTPNGSVRVGGLVCWEHWMPLARQALHESGEDIHVAAWPTVKEMLQVASRHYAFEGRCYVLAAGSLLRASALPRELEAHPAIVTSEQQFVLRGGSAIIAPNGRYVCEPVFDAPALLVADLDLGPDARGVDDARCHRPLQPARRVRVRGQSASALTRHPERKLIVIPSRQARDRGSSRRDPL